MHAHELVRHYFDDLRDEMTPKEFSEYVFDEFFGGDHERMSEEDISYLEALIIKETISIIS